MKYIIFNLSDRVYGIDITQVTEVIRMRKITPVPDAASFIEGIASVRGKIITVINLAKKLELSDNSAQKLDRIMICNLGGHLIGLIVNSVSSVVNFDKADIVSTDETLKDAKYLIGMAKINNQLILLVDADKFLTKDVEDNIAKVKGRIEVKPKVSQ